MSAWHDTDATGTVYLSEAPSSVVGSITGYRTWRVRNGRLLSLTRDVNWPLGGKLEARNELKPYVMVFLAMLPASAIMAGVAWAIVRFFHIVVSVLGLSDAFRLAVSMLEAPFIMAIAVALPALVVARFVRDIRHLLSPRVVSLLRGPQVFPNERTAGIYALYAPQEPDEFSKRVAHNSLLVMGTVSLWGKTIEYTKGVKGQYAHPESLTHVACMGCWQWMPIDEYQEPSQPPVHVGCSAANWIVKQWQDQKLSAIRDACPGWFRSDGEDALLTTSDQ